MNEKIEIKLNFNRNAFEEIYFINNQGHYAKDPTIKNSFRYLLISVIALILFILYSTYTKEYGPIVIPVFGVVIFGIKYYDRFVVLKEWKKVVIDYLNKEESYSSHELILTKDYISIIQDNKEVIEKWNNFDRIEILDNYITLQSKELILIPCKSMSNVEYKTLKEFVSKKVK